MTDADTHYESDEEMLADFQAQMKPPEAANWRNSEPDRGVSESSDNLTQEGSLSKDRRNIPTAARRRFSDLTAGWPLRRRLRVKWLAFKLRLAITEVTNTNDTNPAGSHESGLFAGRENEANVKTSTAAPKSWSEEACLWHKGYADERGCTCTPEVIARREARRSVAAPHESEMERLRAQRDYYRRRWIVYGIRWRGLDWRRAATGALRSARMEDA